MQHDIGSRTVQKTGRQLTGIVQLVELVVLEKKANFLTQNVY
jgi:hypothetical protein